MMGFVTRKNILMTLLLGFVLVNSAARQSHATVSLSASGTKSFLTLSDIHFDPFVACYKIKEKPCPMISKLRQSPIDQWEKIFSTYDKGLSLYRQDTNHQLLVSVLREAKITAQDNHVQFVLVLGDSLGHDFRRYYKKYSLDKSAEGYQLFVKNMMTFISNQVGQAFPAVDIYNVIGNNDTYSGDYSSDPGGNFYRDTGHLWSTLIKNIHNRKVMQQEFSSAGYYALDLPEQKNLRLIVLNSVLFSYKAKGKGVANAADAELDWLNTELKGAINRHQKVLIAMHIPPEIDVYLTRKIHLFTLFHLWNKQYSLRFKSIIQKYPDEIFGVFTGHLHSDWDQSLVINGTSSEIMLTGTPSVSPIYANNPGYKLYHFNVDPLELYDSDAYYYPLVNKHIVDKSIPGNVAVS